MGTCNTNPNQNPNLNPNPNTNTNDANNPNHVNVTDLESSLVDLCRRTVAMNLLQAYSSTTIEDIHHSEEWVSGKDKTQRITACDGCIELRKEVNDLRSVFNLIMPMLPLHTQHSVLSVMNAQDLNNVLTQTVLRKRQADARAVAPTVTVAANAVTEKDCPVHLRTVLNSPTNNPFVMSHWTRLITPGIEANSPTLLNGTNGTLMEVEHHLTSPDDVQVKWSSPSSVDSNGQKTDSSSSGSGDNQHIDVIGDGSDSPSSSTNSAPGTTEMVSAITSQSLANVLRDTSFLFTTAGDANGIRVPTTVTQQINGINGNMQVGIALKNGTVGPERKQRKPVNDDIVRIVRNQDLSEATISQIEIPVPKALESDPNFKAVDEKLIIQQIMQSKKFEEMEVGECMIQLCKKLAEKRVFGPRLMSQTTVAGLNHSNYANLPIRGICYIQHVCRRVLGDRFENDEDFWDKFREAMRKLAARCRRVRHAKKTKHNREEAQAEMLSKRYGDDIPVHLLAANSLIRPKIEPQPEQAQTPPTLNPFATIMETLRNMPISPEHTTDLMKQLQIILSQQNNGMKSEPLSPPPSQ